MTQKYFIDRSRHMKTLKTSLVFGLGCLAVLILTNIIFYNFSGLIIASAFLGGAVLISVISLYRTIFLLKRPLITIDDNSIRYFNVLWYNNHKWDKFELAYFNTDNLSISIGLTNGRIFDKFLLDSLSQKDIENIKNCFITRDKLIG